MGTSGAYASHTRILAISARASKIYIRIADQILVLARVNQRLLFALGIQACAVVQVDEVLIQHKHYY